MGTRLPAQSSLRGVRSCSQLLKCIEFDFSDLQFLSVDQSGEDMMNAMLKNTRPRTVFPK